MKQAGVDKYNVAWFKLADCVSRGEKERALGVYRLLSHSIDDHGLRAQLEGDLLLSFNDGGAVDKYCKAIALYKKEGKVLQAAAVYEHILAFEPKNKQHRDDILILYKQLNMWPKVESHAQLLMAQLITEQKIDEAEKILDDLSITTAAPLHEQLVFAHIDAKSAHKIVEEHIALVVDGLLKRNEDKQLQQFVARLHAVDSHYHTFVQDCMKKR
ncbi:MAG: hypothetical protein Q8Q25_00070 [bacterium]|nr:hypothetical protein [bacterium]